MNACPTCKGKKLILMKANDLSGKSMKTPSVVDCWWPCPTCHGKGYISESDREKYQKSFRE